MLAGLDGGTLTVERHAPDGRPLRAQDLARRLPRAPVPDAVRQDRAVLRARRADRAATRCRPTRRPSELPETAPELAARYPLVFKQGRTFTSFHGFYDEARALPSLAKVNPGPELWISPTDAVERGIGHGDAIEIVNDRATVEAQRPA